MDIRSIAVKCLNIAYKQYLLNEVNIRNKEIILESLELVNIDDNSVAVTSRENENINNLISLIMNLLDATGTDVESYDKKVIENEIELAIKNDNEFKELVISTVTTSVGSDKLILKSILKDIQALGLFKSKEKISKILAKATYASHKTTTMNSVSSFVNTIMEELETTKIKTSEKDPAIIDRVNIANKSAVKKIFQDVKDITDTSMIFKLEWEAVNEAFDGGLRAGQTLLVPASQHNYKTSGTLSIFRQIATANKPVQRYPDKKPMLVRYSFEDSLANNFLFMYKEILYSRTGKIADTKSLTTDEMSDFVMDALSETGYEVEFSRINPSDWNYKDIQDNILALISEGNDVQVLVLDYLAMIGTEGCDSSHGAPAALQNLFQRMRNFCAARDILLVTPHQFSPEVDKLRGSMPDRDILKRAVESNMYSDSTKVAHEVDAVLGFNKIKHTDGKEYLQFQRGKFRFPVIVDANKHSWFYEFPSDKSPIPGNAKALRNLPSVSYSDDFA